MTTSADSPDDQAPDTQADPQSHLDRDPSNAPDAGEDSESEDGADPTGPATD